MERAKNLNIKKRKFVIAGSLVFGFAFLGAITLGLLFRD